MSWWDAEQVTSGWAEARADIAAAFAQAAREEAV